MAIKKLVSVLRFAVPLTVLIFVVLVVFGIYTALDSATVGYANAQPEETSEQIVDEEIVAEEENATEIHAETPDETEAVEATPEVSPAANTEVAATSTPQTSHQENFPAAESSSEAATPATPPTASAPEVPASPAPAPTPEPEKPRYKTITEYFTVCNDCGFKVQGSIYPHQDATGHTRYATDVPFTRQVPL